MAPEHLQAWGDGQLRSRTQYRIGLAARIGGCAAPAFRPFRPGSSLRIRRASPRQ